MCYDTKALPPDAPGGAGPATGVDIELVSADGTHFAAYRSHPEGLPAKAQLVIFPDVRGLHQFYKELALRFAEKGIVALAIDYFGRTAGTGRRDDSFDFMAHVPLIQLPSFLDDVKAALAHLNGDAGEQRASFILGFCMGGGLTLHAGVEDLDLDGVIAFYAGMGRKFIGSEQTALEKAEQIRCPVLGLFGGADPGIPPSDLQKLDEQLDKAGVAHEIVIYPDAPHSFFDRKATEFADASMDAWERVLGFIEVRSEE